jgi:hypothetical protein
VEHYEIAGYGTARTFAQRLGDNLASLLEETLEEESETDRKLTKIAESAVNPDAEGQTTRPSWNRSSWPAVFSSAGAIVRLQSRGGDPGTDPGWEGQILLYFDGSSRWLRQLDVTLGDVQHDPGMLPNAVTTGTFGKAPFNRLSK